MLSVLWRIAFSKYLNDDFSVKRLVYTSRTISNAGEKNLLTSPPLVLLAFFSSVRPFFSSPSLSSFFFFSNTFHYADKRASRMYTRSEIYGTAMKRPLRVRMREFEERGSSNEIRSRKQSTRSSKSWNKQPSEIDFVASDDSPRGSTSPDQWKRRRREKKK